MDTELPQEEKIKRIEQIKLQLMEKHKDETVRYTGCSINCGGSGCILKVRLKDGKITAIEPDDRYHRNVGREDAVATDDELQKNKLQQRHCPFAWGWRRHLYSPNRVLYPLMRAPGSKRGEGKFIRISWDEALTIIAEKMKECKEKYGPYSIITPYIDNPMLDPLFGWFEAGVQGWGWCSQDAERLAEHLMTGYPGWTYAPSFDMADVLFNSKLIVLWGLDLTTTRIGPAHQFAWYVKMAREKKGTPVICIDPRFSDTAAVLADQWIPIKPGTDMAMLLAIAYIVIKEDLYDKEFVERFVEPKGFKKWADYILGVSDGVPKTPEWAEKICAVPAETIRDFTYLYAKSKPTFLYKNWSVARKSRGENSARAAAALQAIMGYWGKGGYSGFGPRSRNAPYIRPWFPMRIPLGLMPRKYYPPRMYRSNKWAQAVLLLDKVKSGELSTEEYRRIIGWRADPNLPNPNPKMLFGGGPQAQTVNTLVTGTNATLHQIEAMNRLEMVVWFATHMTPTAMYADIILPVQDQTFECPTFANNDYGGFSHNTFCPGVVKAPGEAKPFMWIYTKLAEKLGFGRRYNTYYTTDENWDKDWLRYLGAYYNRFRDTMKRWELDLPEWEEFLKQECPSINLDEYFDEPCHGYVNELELGLPFPTKSGKIEICSEILEKEEERGKLHFDARGLVIDVLPNDWRDLTPIPTYQPAVRGMEDPLVAKYPLMLLSSHGRYRSHSTGWDNPWLRGDVYRHALWINVADAKVRGIKDGDIVRVYSDVGEVRVPAYVTTRIMPGVVVLRHGAWIELDEKGVDHGGCPNMLLFDDKSPQTPAHATGLVQVEKVEG